MTAQISPAEFMQSATPVVLNGNTPWAARHALELRDKWHAYAARAPRSLQAHLGPSELGALCDAQVAGKMAGLAKTNHVNDPWPSIRGTALHTYAAEVFEHDNEVNGLRWLTEFGVTPAVLPKHPGTGDLYDGLWFSAEDHKFLGERSMAKVRSKDGPPRKYVVQLLLYADGYRAMGLRVDRVVLNAYPATGPSLDGLYVWERPYTAADDELLTEVAGQTGVRRQWAIDLLTGAAELNDVPVTPDEEECYWCPLFRPQSARDGGIGCPGHVGSN